MKKFQTRLWVHGTQTYILTYIFAYNHMLVFSHNGRYFLSLRHLQHVKRKVLFFFLNTCKSLIYLLSPAQEFNYLSQDMDREGTRSSECCYLSYLLPHATFLAFMSKSWHVDMCINREPLISQLSNKTSSDFTMGNGGHTDLALYGFIYLGQCGHLPLCHGDAIRSIAHRAAERSLQ